jgi:tetratricopeptide (TPR) repeat protein
MSTAAEFKTIGNDHLQNGEFPQAIEAYTRAIELDGSDHIFYSNRSAAYLSSGDGGKALADAEKCIELKADWPKGYSRRGAALHSLKNYEGAEAAYQAGLAIAPEDAGLKSGLAEVQKIQNERKSEPVEQAAGAEAGGDDKRHCRCMFCGELLLLASEDEAIEHMRVCPAMQGTQLLTHL